MGRWSQYDDDSYRLPPGMKRIGYDSDTRRYTFRDSDGKRYQSAPGNQYGVLTPIDDYAERSRPGAFQRGRHRKAYSTNTSPSTSPSATTFQDILPPTLITSLPSESSSTPPHKLPAAITSSPTSVISSASTSDLSGQDRFINAVRVSALPKLHGVVRSFRHAVNVGGRRFSSGQDPDSDRKRLLRKESTRSSVSTSTAGTSRI